MKKRFAASAMILAMSAASVLSPLTAFADAEEQELNIAIFQGGYGDAYWNQMVEPLSLIHICQEFRTLYDNIQGVTPYCVKRVAVLNCWGKMRSWGNHMVHHAIYYKQNYSYFGIIEALSGAPFDVSFISFDDILENKDLLKNFDVVINVCLLYTSRCV